MLTIIRIVIVHFAFRHQIQYALEENSDWLKPVHMKIDAMHTHLVSGQPKDQQHNG